MTSENPLVRKRVLWCMVFLTIVVVVFSLWACEWIQREPMQGVRWRFIPEDGTPFQGEVWFLPGTYSQAEESWKQRISGLSGQLELRVPVDDDLSWYRRSFQKFRLESRVPYRNGLINGSVTCFNSDGHEISIQQYWDGKEHGIYCFFNSDGSFSHLVSSKNGMRDGPCISCWTNGLLFAADVYLNGEKNGLARDWSSHGELREEGAFANYKPVGLHTFWLHKNHAKSHEIQYTTNSIPIETTVWADDGRCIGTGTYKDGQKWEGYFVEPTKGGSILGYFKQGQWVSYGQYWPNENANP